MATLTKAYTFVGGTTIEESEVNTNFDDIVSFCNNSLVHLDGTKTMTGALTLSGSDPASDNVAARKAYVDKFAKMANATLNPVVGSTLNPQTTRGVFIQAGSNVVTTSGSGGFSISYPSAFASRVISVVGVPGDQVATAPVEISAIHANQTLSQFNGIIRYTTTGAAVAGGSIRINWIAIGL